MKGIFAGVVVGVFGALVWALIVAFSGFEIGWLAWGIGAGVGAAVAWGMRGSTVSGVIAVVIAVAAIVGGKMASVEIMLGREVKLANEEFQHVIDTDEEYLIMWVAAGIVQVNKEKGITIDWPEGVDPEQAYEKKDYPGVIWGMAESAWAAMSEEEKAEFKKEVEAQGEANIEMYASSVRGEGFMASFSGFDVIFFLLAIMTAFKVASNAGVEVAGANGNESDESVYQEIDD